MAHRPQRPAWDRISRAMADDAFADYAREHQAAIETGVHAPGWLGAYWRFVARLDPIQVAYWLEDENKRGTTPTQGIQAATAALTLIALNLALSIDADRRTVADALVESLRRELDRALSGNMKARVLEIDLDGTQREVTLQGLARQEGQDPKQGGEERGHA